jgi:hypothetical protein
MRFTPPNRYEFVPGVYNQSITVFDGSQQTASTTLQIMVHLPLRVDAPTTNWVFTDDVDPGETFEWSVFVNGSASFYRGDRELGADELNTRFMFAACSAAPDPHLSVAMKPNGVME